MLPIPHDCTSDEPLQYTLFRIRCSTDKRLVYVDYLCPGIICLTFMVKFACSAIYSYLWSVFPTATVLYKPWDFSQFLVSLLLILKVPQYDTSGSSVSTLGYTVTPNWLMAAEQLGPSFSPGKIHHCYCPI